MDGAREPHRAALAFPGTAPPKCGYHILLIASGMAADEHFAVAGIGDREARLAIVMRWTARHPCPAGSVPAERSGDRFSFHGALRGPAAWKARYSRWPGIFRRATIRP